MQRSKSSSNQDPIYVLLDIIYGLKQDYQLLKKYQDKLQIKNFQEISSQLNKIDSELQSCLNDRQFLVPNEYVDSEETLALLEKIKKLGTATKAPYFNKTLLHYNPDHYGNNKKNYECDIEDMNGILEFNNIKKQLSENELIQAENLIKKNKINYDLNSVRTEIQNISVLIQKTKDTLIKQLQPKIIKLKDQLNDLQMKIIANEQFQKAESNGKIDFQTMKEITALKSLINDWSKIPNDSFQWLKSVNKIEKFCHDYHERYHTYSKKYKNIPIISGNNLFIPTQKVINTPDKLEKNDKEGKQSLQKKKLY